MFRRYFIKLCHEGDTSRNTLKNCCIQISRKLKSDTDKAELNGAAEIKEAQGRKKSSMLEEILNRRNIEKALTRAVSHKGAAGIDE
jgi:hypothetical protein